MKRVLIVTACTLAAALSLLAQTTGKPAAKSAGLGKQQAASNEELNIRAYMELLRTDIRTSKAQIVAEVMALDAARAAKFWPIYKEFESDYIKIGDQIATTIKNYVSHYDEMTDAAADQLANQVLSIEQQRNALKKKYYDQFKESVGAITATRFLQVENQLERIMDLQLAAELPVIAER
ncbi:MAG: hypothetical protein ABI759_16570 [Candidatus Solibacter sp.]